MLWKSPHHGLIRSRNWPKLLGRAYQPAIRRDLGFHDRVFETDMRIKRLKISNFRCFGDGPTTVDLDDLTALIGLNGSGKTAVLLALAKLFGVRTSERTLERSDFHIPPAVDESDIEELSLWIEAILDFPGLQDQSDLSGVPECFRQMVVPEPGAQPFCRIRLDAVWRRTGSGQGEIDDTRNWIITADEEPPEAAKQRLTNYDRSTIQVLYVPATRDPSGQLRYASGALLQPLLRAVSWSECTRETAKSAATTVRDAMRSERGMQALEEAITREWRKLQTMAPLRGVQLQPLSADFEALLKQMEAVFHPGEGGQAQPVERLSDGLRSLFYFSLLGARFDLERAEVLEDDAPLFDFTKAGLPALTVFAIEEPENHLSPHYLGRILSLLQRLAGNPAAQVLLTSQSPSILGRLDPERVRHLQFDEELGASGVRRITLPDAKAEAFKYVKEAVRAFPELYFARAVVLGEGDSEEIVLPRAARATGRPFEHHFVSVVPLGGRHVNHFWRLLNDLSIPHVTLLDLDRERNGGGWGRIKYALDQLKAIQPNIDLGGLTKKQLESMASWDAADSKLMRSWIDWLEQNGVFFAAPLDLDFLLLRAFPAQYHAATDGSGPQIPRTKQAFMERVARATAAVLKSDGASGDTYTQNEREEFIWYQYLFLGRGKPSTHMTALSAIDDVTLAAHLPSVFARMFDRVAPYLTDGGAGAVGSAA